MDFESVRNIGLLRKAGVACLYGLVVAAQAAQDSGSCLAIFLESSAASWERSKACWVNS